MPITHILPVVNQVYQLHTDARVDGSGRTKGRLTDETKVSSEQIAPNTAGKVDDRVRDGAQDLLNLGAKGEENEQVEDDVHESGVNEHGRNEPVRLIGRVCILQTADL